MTKGKIIIFAFFILAFLLRFFTIPQNLFFGPEQGRDSLVVRDIVYNHKLTLIGAKTDIDGIFHGPFFYYLRAIPHFLSGGDPVAESFFIIFLISLSVFLFYLVGKTLFSDRVGIIASFLFTFSPQAVQYARWLSNPPLSMPLVLLFILFLYQLKLGKVNWIYPVFIVAGLLIHLQILHTYFVIPIIIIVLLGTRKKIGIERIILGLMIFTFTLSNFIIFDLRHNFLISNNILLVLLGKKGFPSPLIVSLRETWTTLLLEVKGYIFPEISIVAYISLLLATILVLAKWKEHKTFNYYILLISFFTPLFMVGFSRHSTLPHYFIFLSPILFLIIAIAIDILWAKKQIFALSILTFFAIFNIKPIFTQKPWELTIGTERKIIDFIYKDAERKSFTYEAFTIPYFWRDGWQYMFLYYGQKKYGYIPSDEKGIYHYVIWEDDRSGFLKKWYQEKIVPRGEIVAKIQVGNVHVERRTKKAP